jgi:hypothetical protein
VLCQSSANSHCTCFLAAAAEVIRFASGVSITSATFTAHVLLQLLLELYSPLVISRANKAAQQAPSADRRELMAAARRGLMQAAAKFDAVRAAGSSSSSSSSVRFGVLADNYIRSALRNVLPEVCAVAGSAGSCALVLCTPCRGTTNLMTGCLQSSRSYSAMR